MNIRLREKLVLLMAISLIICCDAKEEKNLKPEGTQAEIEQQIGRKFPIVYWWNDRAVVKTLINFDTTIAKEYEPGPTIEMDTTRIIQIPVTDRNFQIVARMLKGNIVRNYRIEWKPVGYQCFYYIFGGMIPISGGANHLPHSGIINYKIYGLEIGDEIIMWQSHPWIGAPSDTLCFIHVRPE